MSQNKVQPWLKGPGFDSAFILLPPILATGATYIFALFSEHPAGVPLWAWLVFILGIDVSHVYSTLFRTYFNSNEFKENKAVLTLLPVVVWLIGVALYSIHSLLFWRALTYVAVFHFIRQQYGFLRIYCRHEAQSIQDRWLSGAVIYLATLYPIIYWHCHLPRNFHWFIDGDFVAGLPEILSPIFGFLYLVVLGLYVTNELFNLWRGNSFNLPKNAVLLGTAISWYFGIVNLNGDMTFTITNVVSHGIPYIALIWLYGDKQKNRPNSPLILGRFSYKLFFSKISLPLFLAVLLFFSFIEEGLWAGLVWRDHLEAFGVFAHLPEIRAHDTLSGLVPLLTLPQAIHYVLDGFIWKVKNKEANWQRVLFAERPGLQ